MHNKRNNDDEDDDNLKSTDRGDFCGQVAVVRCIPTVSVGFIAHVLNRTKLLEINRLDT